MLELEGDGGAITVSSAALAQIVARAAEAVDGARVRRPRRRVDVDTGPEGPRVELELALAYGCPIPPAVREVQQRVASALATMCGLAPVAVDVSVEELDG